MAATDDFRRQNAELDELVQGIRPLLQARTVTAGAAEIRQKLSRLFRKLSFHLAMEDSTLYPDCREHANAAIRAAATRLAGEMRGIRPAVVTFSRKWTERQIMADPSGFCLETKQLLGVLGDRIRRENTEFYALLDKAG